ncbi:hypothetical protein DFP72DRAFT_131038 [Ephemerocybe angulata]|uniref:Uncharacterized protein n=1 Tax=Ephemerocybe angulata TaxID=980116 RepID=A0A8H6LW37_9AGAR|nr:hypothetical protein DFP72DRAFT_131038 [Tulosesus angulatus]
MANIPIVNYPAFTAGLAHASNLLQPYFTNFRATFGGVPDERGLTDMFLYDLAFTSQVNVQYGRSTTAQEAITGCDFGFTYLNGNKNNQENTILLQAKSFKNANDDQDPVADFTYKSRNAADIQMNVLNNYITNLKNQHQNDHITGGYILYGTNGAIFVPIGTLITEYNNIAQGHTPDQINEELSRLFWRDRALYPLTGFF